MQQVLPGPSNCGRHEGHPLCCPASWLPVILGFLCLLLPARFASAEALMLCVHPYRPASELQRDFKPLVEYLSRELGTTVHLHIAKDYREHIALIGQGKMDIAFMGPAPYVLLTQSYGKPEVIGRLETNGKSSFAGVIFVPLKSPVRSLQDLKGKRFAFGSRESTMSRLMPAYMLMQAGVGDKQFARRSFLSNHDNVILGVMMGDFDAGAVMEDAFLEKRNMGIRQVARTPEMPEHVYVARKGLPGKIVARLRAALLSMNNRPEGRDALRSLRPSATGVVVAADRDYDGLRAVLRELKAGGVTF